ncbi:MAG: acyltransferase [Lachnospiraceae bacterium]|nr:acyltransferase [Lachnospiraceae bacterium]
MKGVKNMKTGRKLYLDNIKWITVVIVAIYHVFYMYNAEGIAGVVGKITNLDVQYYDIFQYFVYPWFMFLLVTISGMNSRFYLQNHTDKEFIRSRTRKLLVPSTIGLFVFQWIQGYYNTRSSDAVNMMKTVPVFVAFLIMVASGIGVLWYIQLLWVLSIILVPIRKIEKDRLWNLGAKTGVVALLIMTAVVFGAAQILNTPIICVYRFGYYGAGFFIGYFVFSHDEVIERLKKWFVPLLIIAIGLGVAFCILYFPENYADAPVNRYILFTSYGWFATLAFLSGGAKYLDYTNPFLSWMSSHSWGLYVFHYLGISLIAHYIARNALLPAWITYILTLVSAFVTAYALYAIISRIPFFRWAVLGIKGEKKIKDKDKEVAVV